MFNLNKFSIIFLIYVIIIVEGNYNYYESEFDEKNVFWSGISKDEVRFKQSQNMQKYLNTSVDPCDDFFEYACGNWLKYNYQNSFLVQPDRARYLTLFAGIKAFVHSLGQENFYTNSEQVFIGEEKLKIYYSSCVNQIQKEKTDIKEFLKIIEPYGGSPLWDPNWKSENFDWVKLETLGVFTSIPIFLERELFTKGYVLIAPNSKLNDNIIGDQEEYKAFIQNILKLTGIDDENAQETANQIIKIENDMKAFFNFYIIITTIQEFINSYKENDWENYFLSINASDFSETIMIPGNTGQIFEYISKQKPENIANFMNWHILEAKLDLFDERYRNEIEKYQPNFFKDCSLDFNILLSEIPRVLFLNKYFEFDEQQLANITNGIKDNLKIVFNQNNWMENDIKTKSLEYLNNLLTNVKRPKYDSIEKLNESYRDLQVTPNKYFENWFNISQFEHKQRLKQGFQETSWIFPRSDLYIYEYLANLDTLSIPISDLQPPNFHSKFPHALNIGGFGTFLTRQIINRLPLLRDFSEVWSGKINQNANCFNSLTYDVENMINEYNAIKITFDVYKKWLKNSNNPADEQLPGFEATPEKLFFINYAQNRCGFRFNQTDNNLELNVLKNFKEFSETFLCPSSTNMNPENKCDINL